jgi:hypothetical protein
MHQLEAYQPTGDDDIDTQWRTALQRRFAQIAAERRTVSQRLTTLASQDEDGGCGNPALLDLLPQRAIDPTQLSEDDQRALYDAFHLQVRYNRAKHQATLRVTIYAEAVGAPHQEDPRPRQLRDAEQDPEQRNRPGDRHIGRRGAFPCCHCPRQDSNLRHTV